MNGKKILSKYREAGLASIVLIYIWAFLTAGDEFWVGRATFFGLIVLFGIGLMDLVMKNGMEKP